MTPSELAERRKALGQSQSQLARRLGVNRQTVAGWEQGRLRIQHPAMLDAALWALEHGYEGGTR